MNNKDLRQLDLATIIINEEVLFININNNSNKINLQEGKDHIREIVIRMEIVQIH
jgi:hypothetical protein